MVKQQPLGPGRDGALRPFHSECLHGEGGPSEDDENADLFKDLERSAVPTKLFTTRAITTILEDEGAETT